MDKIVNWISENPYWTAAGLLATFIALIIAVITPIIQRRKKRIFFSFSNTPLVSRDVAKINGIEILFQGKPVEQVSVSSIHIWNGGNTIITQDDFYKGHELLLKPRDKISILGVDLLKQSEETIECKTQCSDVNVALSFQALEKRDYISLNLYYTGNADTVFELRGKIKEGKIINKTYDIEKQISLLMNNNFALGITSIGTTIMGMASVVGGVFASILSIFRRKRD